LPIISAIFNFFAKIQHPEKQVSLDMGQQKRPAFHNGGLKEIKEEKTTSNEKRKKL